jgi:hypothetical protein
VVDTPSSGTGGGTKRTLVRNPAPQAPMGESCVRRSRSSTNHPANARRPQPIAAATPRQRTGARRPTRRGSLRCGARGTREECWSRSLHHCRNRIRGRRLIPDTRQCVVSPPQDETESAASWPPLGQLPERNSAAAGILTNADQRPITNNVNMFLLSFGREPRARAAEL